MTGGCGVRVKQDAWSAGATVLVWAKLAARLHDTNVMLTGGTGCVGSTLMSQLTSAGAGPAPGASARSPAQLTGGPRGGGRAPRPGNPELMTLPLVK